MDIIINSNINTFGILLETVNTVGASETDDCFGGHGHL